MKTAKVDRDISNRLGEKSCCSESIRVENRLTTRLREIKLDKRIIGFRRLAADNG